MGWRGAGCKFPGKPTARHRPIALDRGFGNAQHLCDLFYRKSSEEPQLDYFRLLCVQASQVLRSVFKREQADLFLSRSHEILFELQDEAAAAPLTAQTAASMIEQDLPDDSGGNTQEMRAAAPIDAIVIDQPKVGFVHQRRALQRVVRALAPKIRGGAGAQLAINQRHQLVKRFAIALAPASEQYGHAGRLRVREHIFENATN